MHWRRATFPTAPLDEITLELVEEAYLTRVTRGPLRTVERPERWHRDAVYDARGSLVVSSQKIGGTNAYPWVAADPKKVKVRSLGSADCLSGS